MSNTATDDVVTTPAILTTARHVEDLLGKPVSAVLKKQIDHLDDGAVAVIAHSPIAGVGYQDIDGIRRATFVGGDPGFLDVRSSTRFSLKLPENATQPTAGSGLSLVLLLPGVSETLRLNGKVLHQDGPRTVAEVQEVYVHCARAVGRSHLWQPRSPKRPLVVPISSGTGPVHAPGVSQFLAVAPFLVCTTGDAHGGSDTSPRGDRPGFVQILDGHTIAIPDRKGNRRADTLRNLLEDDRIALAVLVPNRSEVLHIRGTATVSTDPDLLATMALRGMSPHAALVVTVLETELTDSEPVRSSHLWEAAGHVDQSVPDLNILAAEHLASNSRGTGWLLRLAAAGMRRFPGFTKRLLGRTFTSALDKEGYDSTARPARTTSPARRFQVSAIRRETASVVTIVMHDDTHSPVLFAPGQFFTFTAQIAGRPVRRAYSASSAPGAPELEITVKCVEGGAFSTYIHEKLRVGDQLEVRGPSGTLFDPTKDAGDDLVLIAAGSGVTPMMSIIRTQLAAGSGPRIFLLNGNRDHGSIIFADELARLQRRHPDRLVVTHQLSAPTRSRNGRITADTLDSWLSAVTPSAQARYYLCGPDPMMAAARSRLLERGVNADRIRLETYTSASPARAGNSGPTHQMQVTEDGADVGTAQVTAGETLLDAGLAADLPMPYSCTVGNCGECVVKLLGGRVTMSEPNCLPADQRAAGYVLTCVGRPESPVTIDIADL